ncbi:4-hydroxy-3-methylbut-2-enyl diphosphate reductase [Nonomuraea phyllanthi]|uniref:4-hydroxy-3-methylbut-2-enyl diphosphate reductase n=1 Tax=Nonomuraea phyllanthi TaxID=2219224 RepID=A0A5C4WCF5_9ACTN|nr:4-hydroxy-3-methylbut-2-enyl diphosphate reductase [Nonomuraea phyllanthi]KAB8193064.1 4-hydroxy-3-methylbut-2-enyl diphosphate reductase [Nonomuraea phyllanthi]QFY11074.1 4-hydroxy-3-methylbut-2-enyl diphosphate reductase [Nonomuraea phyllanthi]
MTGLLICAALGVEVRAIRRGLPSPHLGTRVIATGLGLRRAGRAAARLGGREAVAVVGFGGAVHESLRPGDVLVASEVRFRGRVHPCPSAPLLAGELARAGLPVRVGPLVTSGHVVMGAERRRLAAEGAYAVDMETGPLARAAEGRPLAAVRVIVDTPRAPLLSPGTLARGMAARRTLALLGPVLTRWSAATGPRTVLLAAPRSFCAGVERAIEIVELALERYGPPVYVRKQIVHNLHVVEDLNRRGAVFVDELDEVPAGAVAIFSAHGVAPEVREEAARRDLRVVDATCPLVSKVHAEARRFASEGRLVLLIGHAGHEEAEGTLGEAGDSGVLVQTVEDVAALPPDRPVSYLMQTTLAEDEAAGIAAAIRDRFPEARGPRRNDICYATTNRQQAVRAIAEESDVVVVVGSANSSNSQRLVEVAAHHAPAHLVDDRGGIALDWLAGARTVGLTAGASAPPALVDDIVAALRGLGEVHVEERVIARETVQFSLPKEALS